MLTMAAPVRQFLLLLWLTCHFHLNTASKQCRKNPCRANCDSVQFSSYFGGYASCEELCGAYASDDFSRLKCHCDSLCTLYGDCCSNFAKACPNEAAVEHRPDAIFDHMRCVRTSEMLESAYMVTNCTRDATACRWDATDPTRSVPMMDATRNISYINYRCAMCNGVPNATMWNVELRCPKQSASGGDDAPRTLSQLWNGPDCGKYFTSPHNVTTRLCSSVIHACDDSCQNQRLIDRCVNGAQSLIYHDDCHIPYKNPECRLCGGRCVPLDADPVNDTARGTGMEHIALSSLMRFSLDEECQPGEMATMGVCMNPVCPDEFTWKDDRCVHTSSNSSTPDGATNSTTKAPCATVSFTPDQYEIINNTIVLSIFHEDISIPRDNYTTGENGTISICDHVLQEIEDKLNKNANLIGSIEGWLTLVLMSLSLICLLIRIALQRCVPRFHSKPGQMQFHLCVSAFIAFLFFLVGTGLQAETLACVVFAIIRHWAFLTMFMWTSMLAFDVWMTFRHFKSSIGFNRSVKVYALSAYLGPLLIVIPAVIVDQLASSDFQPAYGTQMCWITKKYALAVYFIVPMAVCLGINLVLLTVTAVSLHRGLLSSTQLQSQSRQHSVSLYIKLAVLLGVTWILGFLAAFIDHPAITIPFSVLNSLQGVFLFVTLTLNSKVWKELKQARKTSMIPFASSESNSIRYMKKPPSTSSTAVTSSMS